MSVVVDELVEEIDKLSAIDLGEVVDVLEKKWRVSRSSTVAVAPAPVEEIAAVQTEFDVKLGDKYDTTRRIAIIREVRAITGLSLPEARELVEANGIVKKSVSATEAEAIKVKLEAAGAQVILG